MEELSHVTVLTESKSSLNPINQRPISGLKLVKARGFSPAVPFFSIFKQLYLQQKKPCSNYTTLNHPWRATNESADDVCDQDFEWDGWYRLRYQGIDIRMPESCSQGCSTAVPLWLNGSHPQIDDGIATIQVCGNDGTSCCSPSYSTTSIRVKACKGNFYVYEFIKPALCNSVYCADINTLRQNTNPPTTNSTTPPSTNTTTNSSSDPCLTYTALDK
ncbi:hypothetical protein NFI96_003019 [Prochilodus magdalenae]|nr:hypothetical protein NFI96_003019 [Prochilodus magdalenae]